MNNINKLVDKYNLGIVESIDKFNSSQNLVYKVITNKGRYVVKEYSNDAIGSYYQLSKRKNQIMISELLNKKGIKCSLPINISDTKFILFNKHYYLIYNYLDYKPLDGSEVTLEHINVLASTQAQIHKIKTNIDLKCSYKNIKIDFDKYLRKAKRLDKDLYNCLSSNLVDLINIINNCNNAIRVLKKNLCIGHNDYKLLNVLWNKLDMVLIDFDALGLSNPTVSLCESAFTFSKMGKRINYDYYEEYIKCYIKEYGQIKENYESALNASLNGKLQWYSYLLSKIGSNGSVRNNDVMHMTNELVLYYKNIHKFNRIYKKIVDELY